MAIVGRNQEIGPMDYVKYERPVKQTVELLVLERLAAGLTYPEIVTALNGHLRKDPLRNHTELIVADVEGGEPAGDYFKRQSLVGRVRVIRPTNGEIETLRDSVPTVNLVANLTLQVQTGVLKIPEDLPLRGELQDQIASMQKPEWLVGGDDLVSGLMLAAYAGQPGPLFGFRAGRII
jgi:hypothetical protein